MRHEKTSLGAIKKYNWIFRLNPIKDEVTARRLIENYPIISDEEFRDLKAFYEENKYNSDTIAKYLYGDIFLEFYSDLIYQQIMEILTLNIMQIYPELNSSQQYRVRKNYNNYLNSLKQ